MGDSLIGATIKEPNWQTLNVNYLGDLQVYVRPTKVEMSHWKLRGGYCQPTAHSVCTEPCASNSLCCRINCL